MTGSAALRFVAALAGVCFMAACGAELGEWQSEDEVRWRTLASPSGRSAGFRQVAPARTGVTAGNYVSGSQITANRHVMHGSGVAIGDVDGDGRPDIALARLFDDNVLYRNDGHWRFTDVTREAGIALPGRQSTGVALADLDGDGDLDMLVTTLSGPGAVLRNNGMGRFADVTNASGLALGSGATTMALADIDGDHDLDLYVARYKRIALADSLPASAISWEEILVDSTYKVRAAFEDHYRFRRYGDKVVRLELAEPDALYLNDGTGVFEPADWTGQSFVDAHGQPLEAAPRDWALTARFHDINGDGFADLYVCNDFESEDALWFGDGTGTMKLAAPHVLRKTSNATMSVDFSDIDRDGHMDIFLTDMLSRDYARRQRQRNTRIPLPVRAGDLDARPQEMQNMLFLNRGDATFAEVARLAGVAASDWSWATSFLDVDLDGYEDLLITTGHVFDIQDLDAQANEQERLRRAVNMRTARALILDFPPLALTNVAFRNRGDRTFTPVPNGWGLGKEADVSHGMALGDLDGDGDLDVVINRLNAAAGLYENRAPGRRIAVRIKGPGRNTYGVGTTVHVYCEGLAAQQKEITAGGQYVSHSQMVAVFAATEDSCSLEVAWPGGKRSSVASVLAGRLYEVSYEGAVALPALVDATGATDAVFVSTQVLPPVTETLYHDFARQPLLPRRLSRRGPAAAAADLDGDGDPDLVLGAGMGGRLTAWYNRGGRLHRAYASAPVSGDVTGIVVLPDSVGTARILAGIANYERTPDTTGDSSYVLELAASTARRIPFGLDAPGPMALADMDGDGDLDLFVGGSFRPGAYPLAATSRIYRNTAGRLEPDDAWSRPFYGLGMTSGVALGDLDGDSDADVVLAQDWGPLRVMMSEGGTFVDRTQALGLAQHTGWWRGVAMGDFDEDGRLDLVATNWGWNHVAHEAMPVRLYYGDIDANGMMDLFEALWEPSLDAYVPARQLGDLASGVPALRRRFASHAAFASLPLAQVLQGAWSSLHYVEATTLSSTAWLNRGSHFEVRSLPQEAQQTVASGVVVVDIDADGHEDLVLAQNYFALPLSTSRHDAGRGLWLRGDGHGGFISMGRSGLAAYGEQRAAVTADWDQDGRSDLLITQHGAAPVVLSNVSSRSGLRVRLEGPADNPWGIGATVRIIYADSSRGPARLVTAGSGYWSQQAPVLVLGRRWGVEAAGAAVRWSDGATSLVPVVPDALEVTVQRSEAK